MPDERDEFLRQSIESHDRQIGELVEQVAKLAVNGARLDARIAAQTANIDKLSARMAIQTANIDKLVEVTNRDAIDIVALARIAERHERRLDRIEGQDA